MMGHMKDKIIGIISLQQQKNMGLPNWDLHNYIICNPHPL